MDTFSLWDALSFKEDCASQDALSALWIANVDVNVDANMLMRLNATGSCHWSPHAKGNDPRRNFIPCREGCRAHSECRVTVYCTAGQNEWMLHSQKTCHQSDIYCRRVGSLALNMSQWQGDLEKRPRVRSHARWIHLMLHCFHRLLHRFSFDTSERRS